jgi:hypothetical protein
MRQRISVQYMNEPDFVKLVLMRGVSLKNFGRTCVQLHLIQIMHYFV